ncbi:MAG: hypothetical protein ABSH12_01030 [Endomicrobiales bacterium]|jgi:hypothetical protein
MSKASKWVIGVIVFLALLIGLGPIFVAKIARRAFKLPHHLITAPLRIKAKGTVSLVNGIAILTTPRGMNHYILVGDQLNKITKQANNMIYVFGTLMAPATSKVNDIVIRAAINVSQVDLTDFTAGTPVSDQLSEAIRQKVKNQVELREKVLTKLGMKNSGYEVISGKLVIIKTVLLRQAKETYALLVKDKYGDQYVLCGQFKYPVEDYAVLSGKDFNVVVVGEVTAPDPGILPLLSVEPHMTFAVKGIYNDNDELSELLPKQ